MLLRGKSPVVHYSPDEILQRGLELAGYDITRQKVCRRTNLQRFKSAYGSSPIILSIIWCDLQTTSNPKCRIDALASKNIDMFFLAFNFLFEYGTEHNEAGQFDCDEKTGRKWKWYFVEKINNLKDEKIVWPAAWKRQGSPTFLYSVDGTHCRISEPMHKSMSKNPKWFSHKDKHPALTYELALSLWEPKLVWISPGEKASVHDITVFRRKNGLKSKTPKGKRGVGDLGYRGESKIISTPSSSDPSKLRKFKSRARARQETFNARIKTRGCLNQRFRHGLEKHEMCFVAVCIIVQYEMENGSPVFDI